MIVRCGRCGIELEVSGPGEFACPSCGTRNAVRGGAAPPSYDLGGLTVPGGVPPAAPPQDDPDPSVRWERCPACSFRFAMGEVAEVTCPNCAARLADDGGSLQVVPS